MSITVERKQVLIGEYATKEKDTGSPEVQVAVLSERIEQPDRAPEDPRQGLPLAPRAPGAWSAAGAACSTISSARTRPLRGG